MLMIKPTTPSDEGIPAIISTGNGENIAAETEGDASAVTSTSEAQQTKQVRMSSGSYSNINGPPIGPSGRPIGVKKTKAGLKEALVFQTEQRDIATERHEEVAHLLASIGQRMNQLAKRIDVQSSFLGSFVYLQMGDTAKAHALADSGQTDLLVPKDAGGGTEGSKTVARKDRDETTDDDDEKKYNEEDEADDDVDDDDDENEKENLKENQKKRANIGSGSKKKKKYIKESEATSRSAVFGNCTAGRRCGRFAETGGRLDRLNFSPNAGEDVDEIIEHPKHRCTGCCQAFCGGTCGIGESADDYICNECLSMP